MKTTFDENKAKESLEKGMVEARQILKDEQKVKNLIQEIEDKMENSKLNDILENIPIFVSCVKSYIKREYTEIPVGSILAIISALVYWVSPIDIIPDVIPGVGYIDDAAVVLVCLKMIKVDLDEYKSWLEGKEQRA